VSQWLAVQEKSAKKATQKKQINRSLGRRLIFFKYQVPWELKTKTSMGSVPGMLCEEISVAKQ
jgi:hypothetical protein